MSQINLNLQKSYSLEVDAFEFRKALFSRHLKLLVIPHEEIKISDTVKLKECGEMLGNATGRELWMTIKKTEPAALKQGMKKAQWWYLECV